MKEIKSIGTTSFILHDTRFKNVEYLKGLVDIVQLLYLESYKDSMSPEDLDEIKLLQQIKTDIEYFIHMPIDLNLSRKADWVKLNRFANVLKQLNPQQIIIHPENDETFFEEMVNFIANYPNTLIENINEVHFFDKISSNYADICFDVGHAIIAGVDIKGFLNRYKDKIKAYHLHGVKKRKDHLSVRYIDLKLLKYLLDFSIDHNVKIIIEVFGEKDFYDSKEFLRGFFRDHDYIYHRWD
ncbi:MULTISPECIES: cobamide remodeling phosphodiesterase CbiR [Calditerrivibrio]|jgi:sugar phosphate isomerase/epimerase|uniref:Xylose isomerase-like TIM barrel domain-containing protein n=1 Tax=Calditerrivibrio nitroreducens TaxID=477976 RepID=A0A2J6WH97_9BACT|nr:MAG: hypothetical protein C0187_06485 [Calditerrivibrio nitroreducens]